MVADIMYKSCLYLLYESKNNCSQTFSNKNKKNQGMEEMYTIVYTNFI